jgi:hypothetical protein
MARRLKTIAKWINENMYGYHAYIKRGYYNTDRKISGTRLRRPGHGRYGNRLVVVHNGRIVYDHNAAETYRRNWEVEDWIEREHQKAKLTEQ